MLVARLIRFKRCKRAGFLSSNDLEEMVLQHAHTQLNEQQSLLQAGDVVIISCGIHSTHRLIMIREE